MTREVQCLVRAADFCNDNYQAKVKERKERKHKLQGRTNITALESQNECRLATARGVLHLKLDFSSGSLVHGQKLDGGLKASNNLHDSGLGSS
jgi:hypothetical protein